MADISRADVATLIREEYGPTIIGFTARGSHVLAAARASNRLVNMGTKVRNMPVQTALATAGWVGESATAAEGVKPQSEIIWGNRQLVAEEVAVIMPVHENVLEDATEDLLESITQNAGMALGVKVDRAVFFGTEKPASWTSPDLTAAAVAAGNVVEVTAAPGQSDLYGAFLRVFGMLDEDGHDPGRLFAPRGLRWRFANLRDTDNRPLLQTSSAGDVFDGVDATWVQGADGTGPTWNRAVAEALVVDPMRMVMGMRSDVQVKFLDQATLGTGVNQINLAERDMVALRFKIRVAYVLATGINLEGTTTNPVGVVRPDSFTP